MQYWALKIVKRVDLLLSVVTVRKQPTKGHEDTFGGDGYICYLDCGYGFKTESPQNRVPLLSL